MKFKRIPIVPKKLSSKFEKVKNNTFSNLRDALATADSPLEINDDDDTSCDIDELKSPPTPKADSPKKSESNKKIDFSFFSRVVQKSQQNNKRKCVFLHFFVYFFL